MTQVYRHITEGQYKKYLEQKAKARKSLKHLLSIKKLKYRHPDNNLDRYSDMLLLGALPEDYTEFEILFHETSWKERLGYNFKVVRTK